MPYSTGARFESGKRCLPGTRTEILDDIIEWVDLSGDDAPRVFLLTGTSGSGKSAIAHTVARYFDQLMRLGSSYCFKRDDLENRRPAMLFSTIARDLADYDLSFKSALVDSVGGKRSLRSVSDLEDQLDSFILNPMSTLTLVGPVVVVIDALDESADLLGRRKLLELLATKIPNLPSNFRVFLTSRPESDVIRIFKNNPLVHIKSLDDTSSVSTMRDITAFVCHELGSDLKSPFNDVNCQALARRSEGLFQWAYVMCSIIKHGDSFDDELSPGEMRRAYEELVPSAGRHGAKADILHNLYSQILMRLFPPTANPKHDRLPRFRLLMSHILAAFEPLSTTSLIAMFQPLSTDSWSEDEVTHILHRLGSLLKGVSNRSEPIRILHTSFRDFLLDESKSGRFHVNPNCHSIFAIASLRTLNTQLRFNICGLETSYQRNQDVPDLASRIQQSIPPYFNYATRFWGQHLSSHLKLQPTIPQVLEDMIQTFLGKKLLFWLETLSILGAMSVALPALRAVLTLVKQTTDGRPRPSSARDSSPSVLNSVGRIFGNSPEALGMITSSAATISSVAGGNVDDVVQSLDKTRTLRKDFIEDAMRFARFFAHPMQQSAPHVYLSAIALSPRQSLVRKHFSPQFHRLAKLLGALDVWPSTELSIHIGSNVSSVAFSPDGRRIVSGSLDGTVRIWDADTGQLFGEPLIGHTSLVLSIAFSPDGRITSGSSDQTIRIWDSDTGQPFGEPLTGHKSSILSVAFSPDGQRIASGSNDQTVRIWDVDTGQQVGEVLANHTDYVRSVAFSRDGRYIVSGSDDKTVCIWDADTGQLIGEPLIGHTSSVLSVAFSPDGRITSGSSDRTVCIWDVQAGQMVGEPLTGHTDYIRSVTFSPDGRYIASGSDDRTLRIWDVKTSQPVGEPFVGHTDFVRSVAFSPDGRRIVSGSDDQTVRIWDAIAAQPIVEPFIGHTECVRSVAFSSNGRQIVSGSDDKTVRIWDVDTGQPVGEALTGHTDCVRSVAFSPKGQYIASGSDNKTVRIWDVHAGQPAGEPLIGHTDYVRSVAFSPDGQRLVSGSDDRTVRIWDLHARQPVVKPLTGHAKYVQSVTFSPDGRYIASGSNDQTVRIWNADTGQPVGEPLTGHTDFVRSVAFSPDGRHIVSGSDDKTVRIWDAVAGQPVGEALTRHTFYVRSVAFSPDGRHIVSGSDDQTVGIWDAATGQPVGEPLTGHTGCVRSVAFSPDGRSVASSSDDQTVRIWDVKFFLDKEGRAHDFEHSGTIAFSPDICHALPNYPSVSVQSSEVSRYSFRIARDGWLEDTSTSPPSLLIWIPPDNRSRFYLPFTVRITGNHVHALDLSQFVHGHDWTRCIRAGGKRVVEVSVTSAAYRTGILV
jgi:WD40 repeat protein